MGWRSAPRRSALARGLVSTAALAVMTAGAGCGTDEDGREPSSPASASAPDAPIGYDVRRLRPSDEPLGALFDRVAAAAVGDGKRVVVLFSAEWCHRCRRLEAELGSTAPRSAIADVRILMLQEEDWEAATRLDEFRALRLRWEPVVGTYPLMVLLGPDGERLEEMKEAKDRLELEGSAPTLAQWFATSRVSGR